MEELTDASACGQAQIIGISVDGVWFHLAFSKDRKLHIPLLADFEPKGAVARQYGVYRETDGESERALFVIDAEGVIRWSYVSPVGINPGEDGKVNGTPTFFVNGIRFDGPPDYGSLLAALESALALSSV